jgi:hypothetical protein
VLCETHAIDFEVRGWDDGLHLQEPSGLTAETPAYLSPSGGLIAVSDATSTHIAYQTISPLDLFVCGWIDDAHLIGQAGTDPTKIGNLSNGNVDTLSISASCAGRIPGGL